MEKNIRQYKIVREVGKGGMGIVYKGLDPRTQKAVAIKVLPVSMVDRSTVERFHREANAMARVKHPNLMAIYEHGMDKGEHFLVMEFIDGETLKSLVRKKGALSETEVLDIIVQSAQAIEAIHAEGMIHRDIKPGNIMITADGIVKVMDFGLVKLPGVTNVTISGSALGTAEYMSPEQMSDEGVDSRTDIYSLGATMYEMLTGKPPFEGDSFQAIMMKHRYEVARPVREVNSGISAEMENIVSKAMAKDIAQRYQKIGELLEDVKRLRGGRPLPQAKAAPADQDKTICMPKEQAPAPRERKKRGNKGGIIGILILAIILGLGFYFKENVEDIFYDVMARFEQGASEDEGGLLEKTQASFQKLQQADEHYMTGLEYYNDGRLEDAITEYKKAISLRRDYGLYYKDLAIAYEEKGDMSRAIQTWRNLLRKDPRSVYADLAKDMIEELQAY